MYYADNIFLDWCKTWVQKTPFAPKFVLSQSTNNNKDWSNIWEAAGRQQSQPFLLVFHMEVPVIQAVAFLVLELVSPD